MTKVTYTSLENATELPTKTQGGKTQHSVKSYENQVQSLSGKNPIIFFTCIYVFIIKMITFRTFENQRPISPDATAHVTISNLWYSIFPLIRPFKQCCNHNIYLIWENSAFFLIQYMMVNYKFLQRPLTPYLLAVQHGLEHYNLFNHSKMIF